MVDSNGRARDYSLCTGPIGGASVTQGAPGSSEQSVLLMIYVDHSSRQVRKFANDALRVPFVDTYRFAPVAVGFSGCEMKNRYRQRFQCPKYFSVCDPRLLGLRTFDCG